MGEKRKEAYGRKTCARVLVCERRLAGWREWGTKGGDRLRSYHGGLVAWAWASPGGTMM